MEEFRVAFVELDSGNIPFEKFLDFLTKKERAEVITFIEEFRVRMDNSELISTKISKHLKNGIFELRINHLNKISRALYFFQKDKLIIFTHGFIKKTNATPNDEIEKALKYRNIYLTRKT